MKWIRSVLWMILLWALLGFALGTWLRLQMESSPVYIGAVDAGTGDRLAARTSACGGAAPRA
jgi:hypothetical protein